MESLARAAVAAMGPCIGYGEESRSDGDSDARDCFCYVCSLEVRARTCPDLELRCLRCGSDCVELLSERDVGPHADEGVPPVLPAMAMAPPPPTPPSFASVPTPAGAAAPRHLRSSYRRRQGLIGGRGREAFRHVGVICDACQARDFPGIRYRCLQCRDYDLCSACYAQRDQLHPGHSFEVMRTPRQATRSLVAIIEIGLEGLEESDARSGLDDSAVSWWLAEDARLISTDAVAAEDPSWACPICAEGLEADSQHGWVVQICHKDDGSSALAGGGCSTDGCAPAAVEEAAKAGDGCVAGKTSSCLQGHVYHEACLRRWLLRRNSCPVCRRTPVIPEHPI